LQSPVVDLGFSASSSVVPVGNRIGLVLRSVPEHPDDRAGPVGQADLKVEIPVAIGAKLLLRNQENLVDFVAVAEVSNEPPGFILHAFAILRAQWTMNGAYACG